MIRLTLAQMRRSIGRLAAAGAAIAIGAAFVTATLLAGNAITRTTYDAVSSQYAQADLIVSAGGLDSSSPASGRGFDAATVAAIGQLPGVAAVQGISYLGTELSGPHGRVWTTVAGRASDPRLEPAKLSSGRLPQAAGEVAIPATLAEHIGAVIGDTVHSSRYTADGAGAQQVDDLLVTGLLDTPSAFLSTGGTAVLAAHQGDQWLAADAGGPASWSEAMVALAPGADTDSTITAVQKVVGADAAVLTHDQRAAQQVAKQTGSTAVLVGIVLAFAAVSLLVASLVIANTFQVLVAQRTRMLALLRCVGADRRQLRRSVLFEATVLGLAASATGVLLGIALVQAALVVLGRTTDVPVPATVTVTLGSVLIPLAVGLAVTLLASLAPARAATRVSPLAALRPEVASDTVRSGRARAWFSALFVLGGGGALALGVTVASQRSMPLGLAVGMLGGAVSFLGVLLGAVFWVPGLLGRSGRFLGRGIAGRLAAANSVRNPRRVATTSGALFIGVTLVAMMATGAASATQGFAAGLAKSFPIDVAVAQARQGRTKVPLPAGLADAVAAVKGISTVTTLTGPAEVTIASNGTMLSADVLGVDPQAARTVVLDPDQLAGLTDRSILVPTSTATGSGLTDGSVVKFTGPGGTAELTVVVTTLADTLVTTTTLHELDPSAGSAQIWARVTDAGLSGSVVADVQTLTDGSGQALQVVGAAIERAFFQRVIDTLLAIVVGLLGVAVVIAVVGVANTLSLSVIERRRESATLRAIGLTRSQLRATLAIEGLLVAGVGALVGTVLGVAYGWAGAHILLSGVSPVGLTVPWRDLGLGMLGALAAGAIASVLPARAAARTPPVEALAAE